MPTTENWTPIGGCRLHGFGLQKSENWQMLNGDCDSMVRPSITDYNWLFVTDQVDEGQRQLKL